MADSYNFDPNKDCILHKEVAEKIKNLRHDLEKEDKDRRRTDEVIIRELKDTMDAREKLIQDRFNIELEIFRSELHDFKQAIHDNIKTYRRITLVFLTTSFTLWGTVIVLLIHLAEHMAK